MTTNIERNGCDTSPRKRSREGSDIVVPILRCGTLARKFCRRAQHAAVEAVFERSLYLRSRDMFVCIGEAAIGNGPLTLIADFGGGRLRSRGLCPGQPVSISDRCIAIGNAVRFTFDGCVEWRQPRWPLPRPAHALNDFRRSIELRVAFEAPQESLGRTFRPATAQDETPLLRIARPRISRFESWLRTMLPSSLWGGVGGGGRERVAPPVSQLATPLPTPPPQGGREQAEFAAIAEFASLEPAAETAQVRAAPSRIADLVGLGPGLTPSGDDFLVGALALLDALDETAAHAALARAIIELPRGRTSALSECLLKTAAAGHIGEHACGAVTAMVSGKSDQALAAIRRIGHGSGWDMMVGILTALRAVSGAQPILRSRQ